MTLPDKRIAELTDWEFQKIRFARGMELTLRNLSATLQCTGTEKGGATIQPERLPSEQAPLNG